MIILYKEKRWSVVNKDNLVSIHHDCPWWRLTNSTVMLTPTHFIMQFLAPFTSQLLYINPQDYYTKDLKARGYMCNSCYKKIPKKVMFHYNLSLVWR